VLSDDAVSNLDANLRAAMRTEIKELHQRLKTTTIYVTHDQIEAMTMADKIVVMHDGHVQQVDAPLELYDRPANRFVAGFIGSPAMNFVTTSLAASGGALWAEAPGMRIRVPPARQQALERYAGQRVLLGVRPEALRPAIGA